MNYQEYRLQVLSKATGANVHLLNNMLGIVLNLLESKIYYTQKKNNSKIEEVVQFMEKMQLRIMNETGIQKGCISL